MSDVTENARAVFFEALERRTPEDLVAYLDKACGENRELRSRVEDLLRAHQNVGDFLGGPPAVGQTEDMPEITEQPGTQIGGYKLLQKIGEGGMGVVYMAEQSHPVKRRVALKIIKPGMDTGQVIARFEAERQALALMDHPGIATVLDAGATDSGRPYFVMELVKGIPITEYCDEQHFTPTQRLELFVEVCHAVQHAHQKGIIHRDLKPQNVLVAEYDQRAVPKIIDFGVAKATNQQLTEKTMFTQYGQILGTWEYMSPEQAKFNQLDIDTRSDIYTLGVLLYELLVGTPPFDRQRLRSAAFEEMLRIIREEEPPKPSIRLSKIHSLHTVASQRKTEPQKLSTLVRGELDWIVMKALEKDRSRRYETANGLAVDLQHHLNDEPVLACPPSTSYRLRKFVRRNKVTLSLVGVTAMILLLAPLSIGYVWIERSRARLARAAAEYEKEKRAAAERNQQTAVETAGRQARLRAIAEKNEEIATRYQYSAQMQTANTVGERGMIRQSLSLIEQHVPKANQPDSRSFEWSYLWRLYSGSNKLLFTLPKLPTPPRSLAYSPDGTLLATGTRDGAIVIWELASGAGTATLKVEGHTEQVSSLSFSPDGESLASGSHDSTIRVWDVKSGQEVATLQGHTDLVKSVAFGPAGKRLASAGYDDTVRIWDVGQAKEIASLTGHRDRVTSVAFHPDGGSLVSGSIDFKARIWDLATGEAKLTLSGHSGPIWSVAYSPDGKRIATASYDQTLKLWHSETGELLSSAKAHLGNVLTAQFVDDNQLLTCGGNDGKIKLWDVDGLVEAETFQGHLDAVNGIAYAGGDRFATSSNDGYVKVWSLQHFSKLRGHLGWVHSTAFAPDSATLATAGTDQTVRVWDVATGRLKKELVGHSGTVYAATYLPDGRTLATAGIGVRGEQMCGEIKLWNLRTYEASSTVITPGIGVYCMAIAPDGETLLAGCTDGSVIMFDVSDVSEVRPMPKIEADEGQIRGVTVSADGKLFATGSTDQTVKIWDFSSRRVVRTLDKQEGNVFGVAFSPDGQVLAGVHTGGLASIWNVESGESLITFRISNGAVYAVAFTPDGKRLVTGGTDQTVAVWDIATPLELGQEDSDSSRFANPDASLVLMLQGHTDRIWSLGISPDGSTIASGSADRTVRLWRAATLDEVAQARAAGPTAIPK